MHRQQATLRDSEIRAALRARLRSLHAGDAETTIIDELSLCQGDSRVDLAVVNRSLSGYEIKSDRDTLARLPSQSHTYALCFDEVTVVVGSRHITACARSLPHWWGVWEAVRAGDGVRFRTVRRPKRNPRVSAHGLVQLLWKDELIESLRGMGLNASPKKQRRELWAALVSACTVDQVSKIVRDRVRARGDWRSAPTPFRCGGSSRSVASSPRSPENRRWLLSQRSRRRPD